MPLAEPLLLAGSLAGILGLTYATFTAVSYTEVKRRIDEQIASGEDPYELQTDKPAEAKRAKPPQKKKRAPKRKS